MRGGRSIEKLTLLSILSKASFNQIKSSLPPRGPQTQLRSLLAAVPGRCALGPVTDAIWWQCPLRKGSASQPSPPTSPPLPPACGGRAHPVRVDLPLPRGLCLGWSALAGHYSRDAKKTQACVMQRARGAMHWTAGHLRPTQVATPDIHAGRPLRLESLYSWTLHVTTADVK